MKPGEQREKGVGAMIAGIGIVCNSNIQKGNAVPLNFSPCSYPPSALVAE